MVWGSVSPEADVPGTRPAAHAPSPGEAGGPARRPRRGQGAGQVVVLEASLHLGAEGVREGGGPGRAQADGTRAHTRARWLRTDPDSRRFHGPTRHVRTCGHPSALRAASDQDSPPRSPLPGDGASALCALAGQGSGCSSAPDPIPCGRGRSRGHQVPPVRSHQEAAGNQAAAWRAMPPGGRDLSQQGPPPAPRWADRLPPGASGS